jgi:hypothetical protein
VEEPYCTVRQVPLLYIVQYTFTYSTIEFIEYISRDVHIKNRSFSSIRALSLMSEKSRAMVALKNPLFYREKVECHQEYETRCKTIEAEKKKEYKNCAKLLCTLQNDYAQKI